MVIKLRRSMPYRLLNALYAISFSLLVSITSGCGVVIGNTRPVDEKSDSYFIEDLSKENPDWMKIQLNQDESGASTSESSDISYQSKSTSSVISLTSACREKAQPPKGPIYEDQRSLTDTIFLGATDITLKEERSLTIQGTPALETTAVARIDKRRVKLRVVALRRGPCIYTMLYSSAPANFERNVNTFFDLMKSLRFE